MKKTKKLSISELRVTSFITTEKELASYLGGIEAHTGVNGSCHKSDCDDLCKLTEPVGCNAHE